MALKRVTYQQSVEIRDSVEDEILEEVNRQFKAFLDDLRRLAVRTTSPNVLLAAGSDEMPTLGEVANMWVDRVDGSIMAAITAAYERVFRRWTDRGITVSSAAMSASRDYIAQVRDRLVQGTHMRTTVYEESFDKIRLSIATANAEGWSRNQLAQRIAAELSWDKDSAYWRTQLANVDKRIDDFLDKLGEPGTAAREHARLHDPQVNAWRVDRNVAIKHLDAEASIWRERATLIARTEATGAANFGGLNALTLEGVATKEWMATEDSRTRETHRAADGQTVGIAQPFVVGTSLLQFPGDPRAPVGEVANCFIDGTAVDARNVSAGYSREYFGDLVQVTAAGIEVLSGTPNHPVLTLRGWVPLKFLKKSDRLVGCSFGEGVSSGHPDVEDRLSMIEEVVDSLLRVAPVQRVVGVGVNFHGDVGNAEVDVVRSERLLWVDNDPTISEPAGEDDFGRGDLLVAGLCLLGQLDIGSFLATSPVPEILHVAGPQLNSPLHDSSAYNKPVQTQVSTDLLHRVPLEITLHDVISVDIQSGWHGRVSNLETKSGWYTANTIVVHNCRCTLVGGES